MRGAPADKPPDTAQFRNNILNVAASFVDNPSNRVAICLALHTVT
jgi:hypothetical protein